MNYFIFLEFTNPKLRNFLKSLRASLIGYESNKPIHVTVRGPYDTPPDFEMLESVKEQLSGFGVTIGGAGIFKTMTGYVVYLKVKSPLFEDIWWKPDFNEEGVNPHITMFETKDSKLAKEVERFLRTERIQIFTVAITLTLYTPKQQELFEETIDPDYQEKLLSLERWVVKPNIIQRAALIHNQYIKHS